VAKINNRAAVIVSCWLAVAIISSVYIWVALGGGYLGDILFGLFVPVGLLVGVAFIVTFGLSMAETQPEKETKLQTTTLQEINAKIDALTKEVETIKKAIEE
jgi:hypothetical protein